MLISLGHKTPDHGTYACDGGIGSRDTCLLCLVSFYTSRFGRVTYCGSKGGSWCSGSRGLDHVSLLPTFDSDSKNELTAAAAVFEAFAAAAYIQSVTIILPFRQMSGLTPAPFPPAAYDRLAL